MADRLLAVQNAIEALIWGIAGNPFGSDADDSRVFHQGDTVNLTIVPACVLTFAEDNADDIDTRRTLIVAPWNLQVWFDKAYTGDNNRERHTAILQLIKDRFNNNRTISTTVVDTKYTGGGNALTPEGDEAEGNLQTFTCRFESDYRHLTTNSSSAA